MNSFCRTFAFLLLALFALFVLTPRLRAEDTNWDKAKSAYDRGDFRQAVELYRSLQSSGKTSAALDYNLGNALFRLGNSAEAIAHYRRAQWLSPNDPDLRANFERVVLLEGAVVPPLPLPRRMAAVLDATHWLWLWFVACGLLSSVGILHRWIRPLRSASAWLFPALIVLLLTAFAGVWASRPSGFSHEAVLRGKEVTARFEPLDDATARFSLPGGSIVLIGENVRDWVRIASEDNSGWVKRDELILIQQPWSPSSNHSDPKSF